MSKKTHFLPKRTKISIFLVKIFEKNNPLPLFQFFVLNIFWDQLTILLNLEQQSGRKCGILAFSIADKNWLQPNFKNIFRTMQIFA